ncbi:2,3-dihydro-2,3-dihydroxybenzoate dehydrogenase [Streptomyces atriruber]|uniref:2,3-dihydro-2,3-dihydroxybenzoate dehydrogenase n=1 Tax=Streptomyces atriruber TaxID=545121 RepID=A0ABV3BHJ5_9ACTN
MPVDIPNEPHAEGEFAGRTALVTGAGQGIGAAVVTALAARGAHVVATDRDAHGVDELSAASRGLSGTVAPRVMDVTDAAAVTSVIAGIVRDHGGLDLLVNVAGILRSSAVAELTDADWADTFAVNATGVFHTSRAAASHMTARGSGCIVTVGSNAAGIPRTGMAAYAASKAAAAAFTKCLGLEIARSGVRCNVVAPGTTDTAMQRALWPDDSAAEAPAGVLDGNLETYRTGIPLGRIATPHDIADAVVFLASDRARHITLQELYVDGGATLR